MVVRKRENIEAFIEKGGSVPSEKKKLRTSLILNIPVDMLEDVNAKVKERAIISRNAWILEAIQHKLCN